MRSFLLALVASLIAPGLVAANPPTLDPILVGTEVCHPSRRFNALIDALAEIYPADESFNGGYRAAPESFTRLAAQARLPVLPEAVDIRWVERVITYEMTVQGTYQGVPVRALSFTWGLESGINYWSVQFDAPRTQVVLRFGAAVARARQQSVNEWDPIVSIDPVEARLTCDSSM
ncbi:hypothetical protein [Rhodobacter maris]|uniref:Uncharacterized protein n=1 Tax=Rhodobacter maris TaxID=446682 RepID=A0A285SD68_9RHOB|nr:hypothetical protein [Rhodobacter maris]SOC05758.1 hypothetical protein SAMN05877831_104207 [Rhodobacter maris]